MTNEPVEVTETGDDMLIFALKRRAELKQQEYLIDAEIKNLNEIVLQRLSSLELKSVFMPGVGSYTYSHTSRSSFDKDKMKQALLAHQVAAAVVKECVEAATSKKEYDSVTFRVPEDVSKTE